MAETWGYSLADQKFLLRSVCQCTFRLALTTANVHCKSALPSAPQMRSEQWWTYRWCFCDLGGSRRGCLVFFIASGSTKNTAIQTIESTFIVETGFEGRVTGINTFRALVDIFTNIITIVLAVAFLAHAHVGALGVDACLRGRITCINKDTLIQILVAILSDPSFVASTLVVSEQLVCALSNIARIRPASVAEDVNDWDGAKEAMQ